MIPPPTTIGLALYATAATVAAVHFAVRACLFDKSRSDLRDTLRKQTIDLDVAHWHITKSSEEIGRLDAQVTAQNEALALQRKQLACTDEALAFATNTITKLMFERDQDPLQVQRRKVKTGKVRRRADGHFMTATESAVADREDMLFGWNLAAAGQPMPEFEAETVGADCVAFGFASYLKARSEDQVKSGADLIELLDTVRKIVPLVPRVAENRSASTRSGDDCKMDVS